jgi:beta-glucosidase
VVNWTTLNEPWCSAMLGYVEGVQAPGRRDFAAGLHAVHHLLLGHGLAVARLRSSAAGPLDLAITLNLSTANPATDSEADREAARRQDGLGVRLYLDALFHGRYPEDVLADLAQRNVFLPVEEGDLAIINAPLDTLGVNYYFSVRASGVDEDGSTRDAAGHPVGRGLPYGLPQTAIGWEIMPDDFRDLLIRVGRDYPGTPIVITENGAAFADKPDADGFVRDDDRIDYLASHIAAAAAAREAGADIRGYFAWSLLDNFEWAYGYDKRFGLVRVDYETQKRIPKQSGLWYRDTIRRVRGLA